MSTESQKPRTDSFAADTIDSASPSVERVVEVALRNFARLGFDETRLDVISTESGMSKRMIHYHFGDKEGLYVRALQLAIAQLRPEAEEWDASITIPADAITNLVEVIYKRMARHPDAVRLVNLENLFGHAKMLTSAPLADQSSILLHLNRVLMLGQDAGAFRPGISALDVYAIISSLCMFRVTNRATFTNLYGTDMGSLTNEDGMERLVVDAVLAFLTANIRTPHGTSYMVGNFFEDDQSSIGDIYR